MPSFRYTDNSADPCPYCVQWEIPPGMTTDDDPFMEQAVPLLPDGQVAAVVYRFPHAECERSVAEYAASSSEGLK